MQWLWLALLLIPFGLAAYIYWWHVFIFREYLPFVGRIFQEKPLFIVPKCKPIADAEEVTFPTTNQLALRGCFLRAKTRRKGLILFGLEYDTNRWSCQTYCDFLRENGYDIFSFETRGQGESPVHDGYEPLQWVSNYEVEDYQAALAYLKERSDLADAGIGFFGISKGAGAGVIAAADEPFVRCMVTDGMFGVYSTMLPYMRRFIHIYSKNSRLAVLLPTWYYRHAANTALKGISAERRCRYPQLTTALRRLQRPLFMIHGGADTYITPEMAKALFEQASEPKELWIVEGAKHNQAIQQTPEEYRRRVLEFFDKHLTARDPGKPARELVAS